MFARGSNKILNCVMALAIFWTTVNSGHAAELIALPRPGVMLSLSQPFTPMEIKGILVDPKDPFKLDFIVDQGNIRLDAEALKQESSRLIRYFLASLTVPEKDLWVNLSPYEKDRIIPDALSLTEMGRDLLAQDYVLKQLTASMIYPEGDTGKKFWAEVYKRAFEKYGTTDIPVDTFNKVWIMPNEAVVYEKGDRAFIVKSSLKVMLETDYLAQRQQRNSTAENDPQLDGAGTESGRPVDSTADEPKNIQESDTQKLAKDVLREIVIPILENEVNNGQNFAYLRQIYKAMILSAWFKVSLKRSVLGQVYADQNKVRGVDLAEKGTRERIYEQYIAAFKKGVYNYIKEEYDSMTQETLPRKYFSGGFTSQDKEGMELTEKIGRQITHSLDPAMAVSLFTGTVDTITVLMTRPEEVVDLEETSVPVITPLPITIFRSDNSVNEKKSGLTLGSWKVKNGDIMSQVVSKTLSAQDISYLTTIKNSRLELQIREAIAQEVSGHRFENAGAQAEKIIKRFGLNDSSKNEIVKAIEMAKSYTTSILEQERQYLSFFQEAHRFLDEQHPIVQALQTDIDRMTQAGLPRPKLYIAIDGSKPVAFHFGNAIVINLALVSALDSVDEVDAVLAHEIGHHEIMYEKNSYRSWDRPDGKFTAERLEEYRSDGGVPGKLAKIKRYTLALGDALRNIAGTRSVQDVTHGGISDRIVGGLIEHKLIDFEVVGGGTNRPTQIPGEWRPKEIGQSLLERLSSSNPDSDFRQAVQSSGKEIILQALRAKVATVLKSKGVIKGEEISALEILLARVEEHVKQEWATSGLSGAEMDVIVLQEAMGRRSSDMLQLYGKLLAASKKGRAGAAWMQKMRSAALTYLNMVRDEKSEAIEKNFFSRGLDHNELLAFATTLVLFDHDFAREFHGRPFSGFEDFFMAQERLIEKFEKFYDSTAMSSHKWQKSNHMDNLRFQTLVVLVVMFLKEVQAPAERVNRFISLMKPFVGNYSRKIFEKYIDSDFVQFVGWVRFSDGTAVADYLDLEKIARGSVLKIVVDQMGVTDFQLRKDLFGEDMGYHEKFMALAKQRDGDALISFINGHAKEWIEDLESADMKKLFKEDPTLLDWLSSVLVNRWSELDMVAGSELNKLAFLESFKDTAKIDEVRKEVRGLGSALYIFRKLRAKDILSSDALEQQIRLTLNSASNMAGELADFELAYICESLRDNFTYSKFPLELFNMLRDRLIPRMSDAGNLKEAEEMYNYLFRLSSAVDGRLTLKKISSNEHAFWLLPVQQAFFVAIKNMINEPAFWGDTKAAMDVYFTLAERIPDGKTKKAVLNAYADKLIRNLPTEALKDFMMKLVSTGEITIDRYNLFVSQRLKFKGDYLYFRGIAENELKKWTAGGDLKTSGVVLLDTVVDVIINEKQSLDFFKLMMTGRTGNQKLVEALLPNWLAAVKKVSETLGYELNIDNNEITITGPGIRNFVPFDSFVESLYSMHPAAKYLLLKKLLLGPNGVLQTPEGRQTFLEELLNNLPREGEDAKLLAKILSASTEVLEPERVFLMLSPVLTKMFLLNPPGGSYRDYKALGALYDGKSGVRYVKGEALTQFLEKYSSTAEIASEYGLAVEAASGEVLQALIEMEKLELPQAEQAATAARTAEAKPMKALDVIIESCQSLGPMGVRFLQFLGQYMDIQEDQQERFRDVYDTSIGQDKFTAWNTLLTAAEQDADVNKFVNEDLVSLDEVLGGGSIVTVFSATVRNRDGEGNLTEGVHEEVIKIRVPNAEGMVIEVFEKADKVIDVLLGKAETKEERKQYEVARRMLGIIKAWVLGDIRDTAFLELDEKYRAAHFGYTASNGMRVRVAPAFRPNTKDIKREAKVPGMTLNKLKKMSSSGKPLQELIEQESDPVAKRLLSNILQQGLTIDEVLARSVSALVENFSRHLVQPMYEENGQPVFLLHSDKHLGNAILSPDLKTVYPIDRNFYQKLNAQDVKMFRAIFDARRSGGLMMLRGFLSYFLQQEENQQSPLAKGGLGTKFKMLLFMRNLGKALKESRQENALSLMLDIFQELENNNIVVPLKIRLFFKNIISINAMLRDTSQAEFAKFLQKAEEKYKNAPYAFSRESPGAEELPGTLDSEGQKDLAQQIPGRKGGIDLTSGNLNLLIKRDGTGTPIPFTPQQLETIHINGLKPIIINIVPVNDLPLLLGMREGEEMKTAAVRSPVGQ